MAEAPGRQRIEPSAPQPGRRANIPLAYLRTFLIVLVVAHHSAIGYHTIAPPSVASSLSEHLQSIHAISPINDSQRSGLLSLFAFFNDSFFMELLFLLSGLFVWQSLQRKGKATYLRDRLIRLGLPLVAMAMLRPLTYYPTYLHIGGERGVSDFWQQWSAIEWRGGPIWFLEVLLLFDIIVVLATNLGLDRSDLFRRPQSDAPSRPLKVYLLLVLFSVLAYVPIYLAFDPFFWVQWGPAQIEVNRLLLYAVYFLAGILLGAYGIERTFLVPDSTLPRRWGAWTFASLPILVISFIFAVSGANQVLTGVFYALACATTSFAFLAIFLRFVQRQRGMLDSLFRSSYGIYVIHYGVVSWLIYALLGAQLPAIAKWSIVFPAALTLCWATIAVIRRIPGVARVI